MQTNDITEMLAELIYHIDYDLYKDHFDIDSKARPGKEKDINHLTEIVRYHITKSNKKKWWLW